MRILLFLLILTLASCKVEYTYMGAEITTDSIYLHKFKRTNWPKTYTYYYSVDSCKCAMYGDTLTIVKGIIKLNHENTKIQ